MTEVDIKPSDAQRQDLDEDDPDKVSDALRKKNAPKRMQFEI